MPRTKTSGLPRGITQRGTRYRLDKTVQGRRIEGSYPSLEAAIEALGVAEAAILSGNAEDVRAVIKDDSAWTIGRAYKATVEREWSVKKGCRSQVKNAAMAVDYFGDTRRLNTITLSDLESWADALKERGNSASTINRKMAAVSKLMTVAMERGGLTAKPRFPRFREPEGRIRYLSREEESQVLGIMRQWGHYDHLDATVVLVDTGFRTGELWQLEASSLDFKRGKHGLIVLYGTMTKNHSTRSVPMTARVAEIMRRRLKAHGLGFLFPDCDNGWYRNVWDRVRAHLGHAGDKDFVPHALRHTCCSRLIQGGMPFVHVRRWMGHKTMQTTLRYAHLAPTDLYQGVDVLEGLDKEREDTVNATDSVVL